MSGLQGDSGATLRQASRRKGSFVRTARAVAWSFFGVRKSVEYERDVNEINPLHVVIAGVAGVLLFIGALLVVVRWVIGSGVAA